MKMTSFEKLHERKNVCYCIKEGKVAISWILDVLCRVTHTHTHTHIYNICSVAFIMKMDRIMFDKVNLIHIWSI
jgi:hypothetical protein